MVLAQLGDPFQRGDVDRVGVEDLPAIAMFDSDPVVDTVTDSPDYERSERHHGQPVAAQAGKGVHA